MTDSRRKILDASAALVEERGVRAVSFREVARRAGVSHQAPYHHFGNYQGILRAIAKEGFTQLAAAMQTAADEGGDDPLDRLCSAGVAYVTFARQRAGHFRVMFQQTLVDVHDDEEPVDEAGDAHQTLLALAEAVHASGYCPSMTHDEIANLCWSCAHGVATLLVEGVLAKKVPMNDEVESAITEGVVGALTALMNDTKKRTKR